MAKEAEDAIDRKTILAAAIKAKDFDGLLKTLGVAKTDKNKAKIGAVRRALTMARNKGLDIKTLPGEAATAVAKKPEKEEWQALAKELGVKFDASNFKARKPRTKKPKDSTKTPIG